MAPDVANENDSSEYLCQIGAFAPPVSAKPVRLVAFSGEITGHRPCYPTDSMATEAPLRAGGPIYVSIVSNNAETRSELQSYLGRSGVPCHGTRTIQDIEMVAPAFASATIIFPDDFAAEDVVARVRYLRRARPKLLVILVTREPKRFQAMAEAEGGRSPPLLILPKPSFGWELLDAIRSYSF